MTRYRLDFLNDFEFEGLVNDLLSNLWNLRIESFKPGPDQGIDGRFYIAKGRQCCIQSKHWEKSGLKPLIAHLTKIEAPKVHKLAPARYVFATSVPLSPSNKQAIRKVFEPFLLDDDDVLGHEDIQSLLRKYPNVVKNHYKLWFSGFEVLRLITSAAIVGRSQFTKNEIETDLPIYVFTAAHKEAIERLERQKTILVTGAPGVGKSTLAKQLVLHYLANGFELVHIEEELSEAEAVFDEEKKQIFYFDDFLGTNFLEAIKGRQDGRIVRFISRVKHCPEKRFILTTRTTILNRAKQLSESLKNGALESREYEVEVGRLSRLEKAQMLYNHLWHSALGGEYLLEIADARLRYWKVIDHPNFNPRLVSFVTDVDRVGSTKPAEYWHYFEAKLNNPSDVWEGVYENQLDDNARWLLRSVVVNGSTIDGDELRDSFCRSFSDSNRLNHAEVAVQFDRALRLACGSVLSRIVSEGDEGSTITLFNPSIGDYVVRRHAGEVESIVHQIVGLGTVRSVSNLERLRHSNLITEKVYERVLLGLVEAVGFCDSSPRIALRIAALAAKSRTKAGPLVQFLDNTLGLIFEIAPFIRNDKEGIRDLFQLIEYGEIVDYFSEARDEMESLLYDILDWNLSETHFAELGGLLGQTYADEDGDLVQEFRGSVVSFLSDEIDDKVQFDDVIAHIDADELEHEARNEVYKYVKNLLGDYYITFSPEEVNEIASCCNISSIIKRNRENAEDSEYSQSLPELSSRGSEGEVIDRMFRGCVRPENTPMLRTL